MIRGILLSQGLSEEVVELAVAGVAVAEPVVKRKASAYSKRYGKAFKKVAKDYLKKSGGWKKNGFKSAQKAAHKLAKSTRKL